MDPYFWKIGSCKIPLIEFWIQEMSMRRKQQQQKLIECNIDQYISNYKNLKYLDIHGKKVLVNLISPDPEPNPGFLKGRTRIQLFLRVSLISGSGPTSFGSVKPALNILCYGEKHKNCTLFLSNLTQGVRYFPPE